MCSFSFFFLSSFRRFGDHAGLRVHQSGCITRYFCASISHKALPLKSEDLRCFFLFSTCFTHGGIFEWALVINRKGKHYKKERRKERSDSKCSNTQMRSSHEEAIISKRCQKPLFFLGAADAVFPVHSPQ